MLKDYNPDFNGIPKLLVNGTWTFKTLEHTCDFSGLEEVPGQSRKKNPFIPALLEAQRRDVWVRSLKSSQKMLP